MATTKTEMWNASRLAFKISPEGSMKTNYKDNEKLYEEAGFSSDVFSYAGGLGGIHAGLVGVRTDGNICISFKGTDGNVFDWINDCVAVPVPFAGYGEGNVHIGFFNAVKAIIDPLISQTFKLYKGNTIYICGHSKGGAMATLMAKMIEKDISNAKVEVHTFGSPRVGDKTFKQYYGKIHWRYESLLDIVPHICPTESEICLLTRLLHSPFMAPIYEILKPLLESMPYASVGTRIGFKEPHDWYSDMPLDPENKSGETLNSWCAVFNIIKDLKWDLFDKIHNDDYKKWVKQTE